MLTEQIVSHDAFNFELVGRVRDQHTFFRFRLASFVGYNSKPMSFGSSN